MGKIELSMEGFASEQDFLDAVAQATAALPGSMAATAGFPNRDSSGKLVSATVGLPGNATAQDRTAARNAIVSANPGVSKAVELPIEVFDDFDANTPLDIAPANLTINEQLIDLPRFGNAGKSDIRWSASADAVGATGSAFENFHTDGTFSSIGGALKWVAVQNNLNSTSGFILEYDVKAKNPSGTFEVTALMLGPQPSAGGEYKLRSLATEANWMMRQNDGSYIDTGILKTDFIHVKMVVTASGLVTYEADVLSTGRDFGFKQAYGTVGAQVSSRGVNQSIIIDNYSLDITDV